ncbi:flagellar assembly peptidoglycan hydrolase FlgJ [Niveibacterium umoris]|uniref:Peptidoglycan hydrolase FlgJ n=1 Tax=Niveibacterium umoris TaxID=1193620 RepID=A0A840BKU1_9RHOO|nr:flagellar assembly peptidoglycan hydrolase FlgJ [Niveibacterium umoris]MBB4011137.1 flagellar protein FlgJ [Niveibacterium umoris]
MAVPIQDSIFDTRRLGELKRLSGERSPEALKAVAQQFEALFMQLVIKQMRQSASFGDAPFDGETAQFYRGMADQQLALNLSKKGGLGLAKAIERQLGASMGLQAEPSTDIPAPPRTAPLPGHAAKSAAAASAGQNPPDNGNAASFIDRIWNHAKQAAQSLGVPTQFIVGHAALETGWGKSEIARPDGSPSYNLFNVKAGSDWKGDTVEASTIEYIGGVATRRTERFRAYASYDDAFRDYARLIGANPRYAQVAGQSDAAGFARALSRGGYATDPMYADKLTRIIGGNTLRAALSS